MVVRFKDLQLIHTNASVRKDILEHIVKVKYIVIITEEFEDTKVAIRIRKLKKDGQHNGQMKKRTKDNQRSTKHTHKAKGRVTRTQLKTGVW